MLFVEVEGRSRESAVSFVLSGADRLAWHQNAARRFDVADDSADTWSHRDLFWLDSECVPVKVAGVPPDAFTADGQLWGNPLYLWDVHRSTEFDWWHRRIFAALEMYDVVRIDHFRGFESFYAVDYGETTARNGAWLKGPGLEILEGIRDNLMEVFERAREEERPTAEVADAIAEERFRR